MTKPAPACTKCSTPLPAEFFNAGQLLPCPQCAAPLRVEVFPAYFRAQALGSAGEALQIDSEASCFYHPQKRAAVVCSHCGRFLCALCDLELDNVHYCASCLESGKEKNKIAAIDNHRTLHDVMSFHLALLGFVFYLAPATAPTAIYFAVKHWKSPTSIVRKPSRAYMGAAIVIASLQLLGGLALIGFLLTR